MIIVRFLIFILSMMLNDFAFSQGMPSHSLTKVMRAAGTYQVAKISKQVDGGFVIEFVSVQPTGRFDLLKLSSDHIHVAVKLGDKIRLSAEVFSENGSSAEVSQMVVFFSNPIGAIPVWLLSNKTPPRDLNAVNYLKMHVPQTDYTLL